MNTSKIRIADKSEIEWINHCYDEVEFTHSTFDQEIIVIAEFEGKKAGLGRLVAIDQKHFELGGIYVFTPFRRKGIAKEIVTFLLTYIKPDTKVYCIPFAHLLPFYQGFGFRNCPLCKSVPQKILDKYQWCHTKYDQPSALLELLPSVS